MPDHIKLTGKAGDILFWNGALYHAAMDNTDSKPRRLLLYNFVHQADFDDPEGMLRARDAAFRLGQSDSALADWLDAGAVQTPQLGPNTPDARLLRQLLGVERSADFAALAVVQPAPASGSDGALPVVTAKDVADFDRLGYFVLPRAIPPVQLALLQRLADDSVAARESAQTVGDSEGAELMKTDGGRCFVFGLEREHPEMYAAVLGEWAESVLRALTSTSSLFHSEFVVKAGGRTDSQTRFGWHQDGGYTTAEGGGEPNTPHISVWCALDDMSEENGGLHVMPFDRNPIGATTSHAAPRPGAQLQPMFQHQHADPGSSGENVRTHLLLILSPLKNAKESWNLHPKNVALKSFSENGRNMTGNEPNGGRGRLVSALTIPSTPAP